MYRSIFSNVGVSAAHKRVTLGYLRNSVFCDILRYVHFSPFNFSSCTFVASSICDRKSRLVPLVKWGCSSREDYFSNCLTLLFRFVWLLFSFGGPASDFYRHIFSASPRSGFYLHCNSLLFPWERFEGKLQFSKQKFQFVLMVSPRSAPLQIIACAISRKIAIFKREISC